MLRHTAGSPLNAQSSAGGVTSSAAGAFSTTHWSLVLAASEAGSPDARAALEELCRLYWPPLYGFVRRRGYPAADAQDLTQDFFARFLERAYFSRADPERGRFRTFLLTSLQRFLIDQHEKRHTQKRGDGQVLPLDFAAIEERCQAELADGTSPDVAYERQWATTLLEHALAQVGADFVRTGQPEFFRELKSCLWGEEVQTPAKVLAARFGLSENGVRTIRSRLQRQFRDRLRQEIAHTVSRPEEIDDELRYLAHVLGTGGR